MEHINKKLRFAIFGNEYQTKQPTAILTILSYLMRHGAEVIIDRPYYDFIQQSHRIDTSVSGVFDGSYFDADYVISMGGDGTFLKAATRVGPKQIPIIGINMGRLGFLADVLPGEATEALDAVFSGRFRTESHTAIMVEADGERIISCPYALNDIAVLKRDMASMISIDTFINGEHLITYQADGLIVSTPTGSTAYSLSNGGPIIVPQTSTLCLTPVAPHSLNIRPIVLADDSVIRLNVESRSHNFLIAIDGRSEKLTETTSLTVRKAPFTVNIVKRDGCRYFASLREKMMWGVDKRK